MLSLICLSSLSIDASSDASLVERANSFARLKSRRTKQTRKGVGELHRKRVLSEHFFGHAIDGLKLRHEAASDVNVTGVKLDPQLVALQRFSPTKFDAVSLTSVAGLSVLKILRPSLEK
ncbi:MAG TPA: hypothetical protein VNE82_16265 [Candidatus Binataceae bacterium]|nr:hypothetical protein [Candidatus Binataceae bacterium]